MINVTKHSIRFQSAAGDVYELAQSGVVIDAEFREELVGNHSSGATLVRAKIVPAPGAEDKLSEIEAAHPGEIIVGSLIAAQAFPGRIVALCAVAGFERVPTDQKRMRDDKFTVF